MSPIRPITPILEIGLIGQIGLIGLPPQSVLSVTSYTGVRHYWRFLTRGATVGAPVPGDRQSFSNAMRWYAIDACIDVPSVRADDVPMMCGCKDIPA